MTGQQQQWGGDLHLPPWMRKLLRRVEPPGDTPERAHETHRPDYPDASVLENADRAFMGPLTKELGPKRKREH
jgi:hypothetical protein